MPAINACRSARILPCRREVVQSVLSHITDTIIIGLLAAKSRRELLRAVHAGQDTYNSVTERMSADQSSMTTLLLTEYASATHVTHASNGQTLLWHTMLHIQPTLRNPRTPPQCRNALVLCPGISEFRFLC